MRMVAAVLKRTDGALARWLQEASERELQELVEYATLEELARIVRVAQHALKLQRHQ